MIVTDLRTALVCVFLSRLQQFLADHLLQAFGAGQDIQQIADPVDDVTELLDDLVLLEGREALQLQVEDGLCLHRREAVAIVREAEALRHVIGTCCLIAGALQHGDDAAGRPDLLQQAFPGRGRRLRALDQLDHGIDVGERHGQTFEHVGAGARFTEFVDDPPRHHLATMAQERLEQLLQVEQTWLTVDQHHRIDAEHALHGRLLEQVVEHDVRHLTATQLDDHAHTVLVGFVAQAADALELLLAHQFGDALEQSRLIHLIR